MADSAAEHEVWVLGAGQDEPPFLPRSHHASMPAPEGSDAAFRTGWERSEDLVYAGQLRDAAQTMRELANLRWGDALGVAALTRAGDLYDANGDGSDAAGAYADAARMGGPHALEAFGAAARSLRKGHEPRRELALLDEAKLAGALDPELADRRRSLAWLADLPSTRIAFDTPLAPGWEVLRPLAVRRDRARSVLEVAAIGDGVLARLPVDWDGRWFEITVEAEVSRTEWDSGFAIGLAPRGFADPIYGIEINGRGGGDVVNRFLNCSGPNGTQAHAITDLERPLRSHHAIFDDGAQRCEAASEGGALRRGFDPPSPSELPDGPWDLVVLATGGSRSALTTAAIRTITLEGVRLSAEPDSLDPTHPLRRQLADGDPATPSPIDADLELATAIAANQLDDERVASLMTSRRDDPDFERVFSYLAHARSDTWGDVLRTVAGDAWPDLFYGAWESTLFSQGSDPLVRATTLRHLPDLEKTTPKNLTTHLALLALRGGAATASGQPELARASLERAWSLQEAAQAPADPNIQLHLAALDAAAGHADDAFAHLEVALARSPTPLVTADIAMARLDLVSLHEDPRWKRVRSAANPIP